MLASVAPWNSRRDQLAPFKSAHDYIARLGRCAVSSVLAVATNDQTANTGAAAPWGAMDILVQLEVTE